MTPDIVSARLLLPIRVPTVLCVECASLGPWRYVVWMAAALPDRTWHSISGYLSHPVCLLLTLQHPSNRALSAFAHLGERNVVLVRLNLNGYGFHAAKRFGHTSRLWPFRVLDSRLKTEMESESLFSNISLVVSLNKNFLNWLELQLPELWATTTTHFYIRIIL